MRGPRDTFLLSYLLTYFILTYLEEVLQPLVPCGEPSKEAYLGRLHRARLRPHAADEDEQEGTQRVDARLGYIGLQPGVYRVAAWVHGVAAWVHEVAAWSQREWACTS